MTTPAHRRLVHAITDPLQTQMQQPTPHRIYTTVTLVAPGGSVDGTFAVWVAVNADNVPAPYLAAYISGHTPTVGDQVAVDLVNGSPLILGRIVGLPVI